MTIHETVRLWQDALSRISAGKRHQERLEYSARALKQVAHCHDMAPPQTFGELCIELAQEQILHPYGEYTWYYGSLIASGGRVLYGKDWFVKDCRRDIQAIRRALYRKHTDPKKERLYQLIDKIRNT